jgi:hypothetical protein
VWWFDEQVRAAQTESDPQRRAGLLTAATDQWAGEPYAEVSDAAWAIAEIARLTELRVTAIELRASAELALGHNSAVIGELERVVREHPTREGAADILATALYRADRQAAGLEVLRSTRIHLADELGLEPGRALRDLERDILSHAPHLDVGQPTAEPPPETPVQAPIITEPKSIPWPFPGTCGNRRRGPGGPLWWQPLGLGQRRGRCRKDHRHRCHRGPIALSGLDNRGG